MSGAKDLRDVPDGAGDVQELPEDAGQGEDRPTPEAVARAEFFTYLFIECGYRHMRELPGGRYAAMRRLGFTWPIIVGPMFNRVGYDNQWCYESVAAARAALDAWDGTGEPQGWHRNPATGRRISRSPDEYDENRERVGAVGVEYVRW